MVHEHIKKIPERREDSNKGDFGRVLVIAGSKGMTGAAYLTSQAALVSGSGLVTCGIPESLNSIMEIKLTEVMTLPLPDAEGSYLSTKAKSKIIKFSRQCDCIAIGPGLGTHKETCTLVKELLESIDRPIVLDADGINALDGKSKLLSKRKASTVITPHPGELAALMNKVISDVQENRLEMAKSVAETTGAIVCLKGHRTVVASPEGLTYVNETGNSGMATGGTGDVLTGIITSFIGQGINDFSAAVTGVYLHGVAGDIAAEEEGPFSLIATDLILNLPYAFDRAGI